MNTKKRLLIVLLCAGFLAQSTLQAGFGEFLSAISVLWAAPRMLVVGVCTAGAVVAAALYNRNSCLPEALRGQLCCLCQEEFKDGDDIVTCVDVYGHSGEDVFRVKHGWHRMCIYGENKVPQWPACPICKYKPTLGADGAVRGALFDYINTRDGIDTIQAMPLPDRVSETVWHAAQNSLRISGGTQLALQNVGLTDDMLDRLLISVPHDEGMRITILDVTHSLCRQIPDDIWISLPSLRHVYVDRGTVVPAHDDSVTIYFFDPAE